jgi:hypothetical protein
MDLTVKRLHGSATQSEVSQYVFGGGLADAWSTDSNRVPQLGELVSGHGVTPKAFAVRIFLARRNERM